jgi:hypothetical protein
MQPIFCLKLHHSISRAKKAAEYAIEFARCKRIQDNWDTIHDDIRANRIIWLEKCGLKERNIVFSPAKRKEVQRLIKERAVEIRAELAARDRADLEAMERAESEARDSHTVQE